VFKFTAGLPVAGAAGPFGAIKQIVNLASGELVSEVEMKAREAFYYPKRFPPVHRFQHLIAWVPFN
jgi:hypothetical protein